MKPIRVVPASDKFDPRTVEAWGRLYEQAHERLEARIKEFDIPPLVSVTAQDLIVVYRFPSKPMATETEGGIAIPETAQREENPYNSGVLMFAAAEALDVLASHGILPGDIVRWAYLAGDEEDAKRVHEAVEQARESGASDITARRVFLRSRAEELAKKKHLRLKTPDIHESVDLKERLGGDKPTMELVCEIGPKGLMHLVRPVIENLL